MIQDSSEHMAIMNELIHVINFLHAVLFLC
jgi:hypothetical protein